MRPDTVAARAALRPSLVVGLTLIASAVSHGADKPIPQDPARSERRFRELLEWHRRTLQGAYDKVGKRDPRWDGPAREALDLAARRYAHTSNPAVSLEDNHAPARRAVDAGCDDPMVLHVFAQTSPTKDTAPEEALRRWKAAVDAVSSSAYTPFRRSTVLVNAAIFKLSLDPNPGPQERRDLERSCDTVLDLLALSAEQEPRNEFWEERWFNNINAIIEARDKLSGDYKAAFDRVDARLAKIPGIEGLKLAIKGNFQIYWGWEARTSAVASRVTGEQFRTFEARLKEARDALTEAWKRNPAQPRVAYLMLIVEKAIGGGDREAMETWFERAMQADGNDRLACDAKLEWLDPKWHGGDRGEVMLAFGKACIETKNWNSGIPLVAADAHVRYGNFMTPEERSKYLASEAVWSDVYSAYGKYVSRNMYDDVERSRFATLCYLCRRTVASNTQFEILGDRLTARWEGAPYISIESLKRVRDDAARRARALKASAAKAKEAAAPEK